MSTTPEVHATPRLARHFRLQWEEVQQRHVLLYPEGMVTLNASAAEILRRCDGTRDVPAIVAELEEAFERRPLDADVRAFLDFARQRGWIAP
ncbi:pyrroloquinoline quinone biosynthesis peptide chaperone PqqD [Dokdonella sp. MW10]|uniref:pyrroloquinoline quinone biosynthesis peptide chaperone PqqD n=1 Tax=Dokdonella sp. MW10 TaxID=2992926 RepID=UPI003F80373E